MWYNVYEIIFSGFIANSLSLVLHLGLVIFFLQIQFFFYIEIDIQVFDFMIF